MPLKINGHNVPYSTATTAVLALSWLIGLSYQVIANDEHIEELADTGERLARIEVAQEATKEDVKEIKAEQKSQDEKLDKILEKVSETR